MATVDSLFVKPAKAAALHDLAVLRFTTGEGVTGDVAADATSIRQVLLVSRDAARDMGTVPGALRENVCVAGLDVDALPSGTVLRVGSARLRLTIPCEPCGLVRTYAGIPPADAVGRRGVLAVVAEGGVAARGDAVVDEGAGYAALPLAWRDRVTWFLERLPEGSVTTYGDLARAVGKPSVARVLPRLLTSPAFAGLHVGDVVAADSSRLVEGARWEYWHAVYQPLDTVVAG